MNTPVARAAHPLWPGWFGRAGLALGPARLPAGFGPAQQRWAASTDAELALALEPTRHAWALHCARAGVAAGIGAGTRGLTGTRRETGAQALAWVAEAAWRSLGQRPHPAQCRTAWAVSQGQAVALGAGQGKTLALALAAVLAAWSRPPAQPCGHPQPRMDHGNNNHNSNGGAAVHWVAAHDTLAQAQARQLAPLLHFCGLRAACWPSPGAAWADAQRAQVQTADLVFGSAKALFAARPFGAQGQTQTTAPCANRPSWVLFDDLDHLLGEEAAQPIVALAPGHNPLLLAGVAAAAPLAAQFVSGVHHRWVGAAGFSLTPAGLALLESLAPQLPPLWQSPARRQELITQALVVRERFLPGQHYSAGEGRVALLAPAAAALPQRTLYTGLQQALEASLGLALTHPSQVTHRATVRAYLAAYAQRGGVAQSLRGLHADVWAHLALPAAVMGGFANRVFDRVLQRFLPPFFAHKPSGAAVRQRCAPHAEARYHALARQAQRSTQAQCAVVVAARQPGEVPALAQALLAQGLSPLPLDTMNAQGLPWRLAAGDVLLLTQAVLDGLDLAPALQPAPAGLALLLAQRADGERLQRSLLARGKAHAWPRQVFVFNDAADPRLPSWAMAGGAAGFGAWLAFWVRPVLVPWLLRGLAQQRTAQARRARAQALAREAQLALQFSFVTPHGAVRTAAVASGRPLENPVVDRPVPKSVPNSPSPVPPTPTAHPVAQVAAPARAAARAAGQPEVALER